MQKDIKTGMLAGTVLCFIAVVWFCVKEQVISQPLMRVESNIKETLASEADNNTSQIKQESIESTYIQNYEQTQTNAVKTEIAETTITHTVTAGQTLSDISKTYYNTAGKWKKIYEANKEQFPMGPDAIRPGMRLVIPQ
ncbi:MAG: LysM peptidoglycan-binding domain-containing protein [Phycisphaerae bacterium]|nr:LysM peptidoglycan-binding domain-containing protein [Phycisphaerae bacterium]